MSCPQCGCSVNEVVNIPGLTGPAGANGSNGQGAFTTLAAPVTFANNVTPVVATVVSSTWMAVGQVVFLSDINVGGTSKATAVVTAVSITTPTLVTLQYLGYNGDTNAPTGPATINLGGSVVSAGRTLTTPVSIANGGTNSSTKGAAQTALGLGQDALAANSSGLSQNLNTIGNTWTEVGTCDVIVTNPGSYLLMGTIAVSFSAVTFGANHTIQLRIQNVTHPATVSTLTFPAPQVTTTTLPTAQYSLNVSLDATALANDHYQLQVQMDAAGQPSAGTANVVSGSLVALPLRFN